MTDADKLSKARNFVTREPHKQGSDRTEELAWEQTPQDRTTKILRLVVFRGDEKSIFTFTEYALLDNHGSKQWGKQLRNHVNGVLTEL